jgi:hypothetical protein
MLIAVAALAPFYDKAFTIDDTLFLRQAEHVLNDPLHPTAFEMVWSEFPWPTRMSAIMPSGPVMAYLLVPCVLAGGREWIGHLTQLLLFALGIGSTASLAVRLGLEPRLARIASLVLVATPTALAMAAGCMPDTPAMAFGVVGVERLVAWKNERRLHQAIVGALALALAALTRSHLVLLWGIAALFLVGDFRSIRNWTEVPRLLWLPLVIAPGLVAVAVVVTHDPASSAGALFGAARTFSGLKNLASSLIAFSTHWTLAIPFAVPWLLLHPKRMLRRPLLYSAAVAAAVVLTLRGAQHPFLIGAAAGIGLAAVWDVLDDARRRGNVVQMMLGAWLLVATPVMIYQHMPSKFQLASAPAVAILLASALGERLDKARRVATVAIVASGLCLGLLIVKADADLGALGRDAARELIAPNVIAGHRVWFDGHWGFQWYAEKAGAFCLTATPPRPSRGDLAVSSFRTGGGVNALFPARTLIRSVEGSSSGGRIISSSLGAGFYGTAWGYLPWAWGDDVLDRYDLWRLD